MNTGEEKLYCNVCESTNIENCLRKEEWEIVRCQRCGLLFVKNIPTEQELGTLYDSTFFADGQKAPREGSKVDESAAFRNARRRIGSIRKLVPQGSRMLDVGCGTGIFLKAASVFYDCSGVDVSGYAAEFAVREFGVDAKEGTIFDLRFDPNSFDVITMWDVVEHMRDPDRYIKEISEIIAMGGLLVLSTGNVDSLMFKIQGANWHLLIPPKHLFYFNKDNITFLLTKYGFNVIKVKHYGQYTNIGYMKDKMRRFHPHSKMILLMDFLVNSLKVNGRSVYVNVLDVMTVYATRSKRKDYDISVKKKLHGGIQIV